MAIEVVALTEADIPGAIQVIQQAFADDPYFKWVFDASTFDRARNYDSLAARCHWGIKNAVFQVAKDSSSPEQILGVSCWLAPHPPSQPESWYSWIQSWVLSFNQLWTNVRHLGRGGLRTNRYWIWKQRQREAQSQIWDDPRGYYFCNIVAVSPRAQGNGVGRLLFEAVTKRADREGVKCYLESSKSVPNVQIYERMGFEMSKEMECRDGDDACMLYCMVRNPKHE
ncbi:Acyl-CoA N-acyltransferase [Penicillium capsulatum]|uniref:Acyl-CoA N-acyltransferase n=1 Tax=Penicillium capsulatum TaxID=69766 RepID=A0A9W9I190_9EURO|nr:Acyl-CoA N-acyltransferase [Penicillium capsulatum]KAJ6116722.1 Acyl-CoA N-acyltransferase [Penicillium capsulatum]